MTYDFEWLNCLEETEKQAFAKIIAVFMHGVTKEDLDLLDAGEDTHALQD